MSATACSMSPRYAGAGWAADLAGTSVVGHVEPERADPPPGLARVEHLGAHLADAAQRRGAEVDRRRAARTRRRPSSRRGTPRWSRPGRARGCARARGRARARGCPAGSSSTSISISSTSAGASDSIPSTAMPSASLSVISASCGCCLAELGGAAAYVVGEQQLAARRRPEPLDVARGCAGRPPRSCGSRRPRRRRTPRAAGAPRSAGRRRRCRRGRRTRRASRPGRRGSTPHRRAGVRRPRARPPGPGASSTGSRSASPFTWGWSTERTGATTTWSGPLLRLGAGVLDPAQHGEAPTDGVAARAQPLVRERLPGRVERDRAGLEQVLRAPR